MKLKKKLNKLKLFTILISKSNKRKLNIYVDICAECMARKDGKSYKGRKNIIKYYLKALNYMNFAKKKYDLSYYTFNRRKYFNVKNKKELIEKIESYNKDETRYIKMVSKDTGLSYEDAKKKMDEAIAKYSALNYRKYALYQFFTYSDEQLKDRMKLWSSNYKNQVTKIAKKTGWSRKKVQKHMERFNLIYDIDPSLYILYEGWKLTDKQIDKYARKEISKKLQKKYNSKECIKVMNDKLLFAEKYKKYINRKFWINDKDSNYKSFKEFTKNLQYIFCKPIVSGGGNGSIKINIPSNEKELKKIYNDLMKKDRLIAEEGIIQHPEIAEFAPDCVSTLRIVSVLDKGQCKIICANMKFGRVGIIADNLAKGGIVADVDLETGVIVTKGVDEFEGKFIYHPDTNKKIIGFKIPNWEKIPKFIEKAMKAYEGVGYIGWDIAITEKGPVIIEGNTIPDLVLVQAPYAEYKMGKKYLFDPYLK